MRSPSGLQGREIQIQPVACVAATNQDLWRKVQERTFRADLYYRLNVFPIVLPALRERREDIPLLARHFVRVLSERFGKAINVIPDETMEMLKDLPWPGNIRELLGMSSAPL